LRETIVKRWPEIPRSKFRNVKKQRKIEQKNEQPNRWTSLEWA